MSEKHDRKKQQNKNTETGEAEILNETEKELGREAEEVISAEETEIEELAKLLDESNERYLRVAAEYDNYRKRTTKEKDGIYPQAQVETIAKFLPVLDNFERALQFKHGTDEFEKGIALIAQNFRDILTSLSVEEIGVVGEPFDPNFHNAILHIEDPNLGENVISQVLEKGYKIGDRIIRHAIVQTAN